MTKLATACQVQSEAIGLLRPEFEQTGWMYALDDLDSALRRFVATMHQYEERSANAG